MKIACVLSVFTALLNNKKLYSSLKNNFFSVGPQCCLIFFMILLQNYFNFRITELLTK